MIRIYTRLALIYSVAEEIVIEVIIIKKKKSVIVIIEITIEIEIAIITLEKIVNVDVIDLENRDTRITIFIRYITNSQRAIILIVRSISTNYAIAI